MPQETYPETKRERTDNFFFFLMLFYYFFFCVLLLYCNTHGNVDRVIRGFDSCGNICGRKNNRYPRIECLGEDYSNKPFLKVSHKDSHKERTCVEKCEVSEGYKQFGEHQCVEIASDNFRFHEYDTKTGDDDFFTKATEDLVNCLFSISVLCLLSLSTDLFHNIVNPLFMSISLFTVFTIIVLLCFIKFPFYIVWTSLILMIILLIFITIVSWLFYVNVDQGDDFGQARSFELLLSAISFTALTIICIFLICQFIGKVRMVVAIFQECSKAIMSMKILLLEPILTLIWMLITFVLFHYFFFIIQSAGIPVVQPDDTVDYEKNIWIRITHGMNIFGLFWFLNFLLGCQHIVIAYCIASWYFTRDKEQMKNPICRSFKILVFYHLGTVAFGSLLLSIIQIIRYLLNTAKQAARDQDNIFTMILYTIAICITSCIEAIVQFITRNAYLITAIKGYNLCRAGVHALKLIMANSMDIAAILFIGNITLMIIKFIIVMVVAFVGFIVYYNTDGIHYIFVPLAVVVLFSFMIAHSFFTVYEIAKDTVFISYCEDLAVVGPSGKPYYMTPELGTLMDESKVVFTKPEEV